jgi:hypothetical protein
MPFDVNIEVSEIEVSEIEVSEIEVSEQKFRRNLKEEQS